MMRVVFAVLGDSLRLLRARKMFGISLVISLMLGLVYASIGFDDEGMTLFFGAKGVADPNLVSGSDGAAAFYIMLFTDVIVRFWLAWIVILLGLISTISIFPDFVAEGSIGVSLSKPVSRMGLFLLKYFGALLFVAVQVGALSLIAWLAIGLRVGEWNAGIFWAVPVVTFVFSLVYCVSVLAAVWTKSTAFSLMAGLAIWGSSLLVQWGEDVSYKMGQLFPEIGVSMNMETAELEMADEEAGSGARGWQKRFESMMAPLPKTRSCTMYLKRLIVFRERDSILSGMDLSMVLNPQAVDPRLREAMERYERRHSAWYVFGTSAVFEAVVIGCALLVFCRRDF